MLRKMPIAYMEQTHTHTHRYNQLRWKIETINLKNRDVESLDK